jgi:hypothetical protein
MKTQTVKVAITQADDSVAIMTFVTLGRGDVLPEGAEWADKAEAAWMREPTETNLQREVDRTAGLARPIKGFRRIDEIEVPTDRTFRNAWKDTGMIEVDMLKARELLLEKLRIARTQKLSELDADWMKATGQGDKAEAEKVEAERQKLRDLPETVGVELAETPEDLKALWPEAELGGKII